MGEGAGILILEDLNHALNRNANIYAEIKGFGASADAHHITSPHPDGEGACNAMRLAISEANLSIKEIGYINAHGTSTKYNDYIETKAIKSVFKNHSRDLPISSTKSMIGHLLGASGGIEAITTILSINHSIITFFSSKSFLTSIISFVLPLICIAIFMFSFKANALSILGQTLISFVFNCSRHSCAR